MKNRVKVLFTLTTIFFILIGSTCLQAQTSGLKAGPKFSVLIGAGVEISLGAEIEYEIEVSEGITVSPEASVNLLVGGPNAYLIGVEGRKYFEEYTYGGVAFDIGPAQLSGRWMNLVGTFGTQIDFLDGVEVYGQAGFASYSFDLGPFFGGRASSGFFLIGVGGHYSF